MGAIKMVTDQDNFKIDNGEKLLSSLGTRKAKFPIAIWMQLNQDENWKLILASKEYSKLGPLALYKFIFDKIRLQKIDLNGSDINIIDTKSTLAKELYSFREKEGAFYKDSDFISTDQMLYPVLKIYYINK